jgi:hypothetical protein
VYRWLSVHAQGLPAAVFVSLTIGASNCTVSVSEGPLRSITPWESPSTLAPSVSIWSIRSASPCSPASRSRAASVGANATA